VVKSGDIRHESTGLFRQAKLQATQAVGLLFFEKWS
jgi:hypothetical protein